MKINFINTLNKSHIMGANRQINVPFKYNVIANDSFEKSISFGSKLDKQYDYSKKIEEFSQDVSNMSKSDLTNLKKIQSIVDKYVQDVKVKKQDASNCVSGFELGTTVLPIALESGKCVYVDKELQINTSATTDILSRKANLVHEFVHICQSEVKEKSELTSFNNYIEANQLFKDYDELKCSDFDKYLSTHPKEKVFINSIQHINNASRQVEKNFRNITRNLITCNSREYTPLMNIEKIVQDFTGYPFDFHITNSINEQFYDMQKKNPNCDKKLFCDYLIKHLETEKEAYRAENDFRNKTAKNKIVQFEMAVNDFKYSQAIACATKMAQED